MMITDTTTTSGKVTRAMLAKLAPGERISAYVGDDYSAVESARSVANAAGRAHGAVYRTSTTYIKGYITVTRES